MRKYLLIITLLIAIISLFNSCYYNKEDFLYPVYPNQQAGVCDTTNITYNLTIKPIFDNSCKGCHSPSGTAVNFDGYSPLSTYLASNSQKLLDDINFTSAQHMPPSGKLGDCEIKQISIWIHAGYPNN
jgi:cytochrome c553